MSHLESSQWHPNYPLHKQGPQEFAGNTGSEYKYNDGRRANHETNYEREPLFTSGPTYQQSSSRKAGEPREANSQAIRLATRLISDMQAKGMSLNSIGDVLARAPEIEQLEQSRDNWKNLLLVLLAILVVVLFYFMKSGNNSSSDSASSLHSIDGLNANEVKKLDELLKRVSVDMSKMTVGYTDGPTRPRNIDKLNSVIESGYRFLIIATVENKQTNNVFGVYVNKQKLNQSLIYSVNHMTILPVERQSMAWQVNSRITDSGPKFGKSDLQFFVFHTTKDYDSMSNLCYNYVCPPGIEYGMKAANEYLAGSEVFRTQYFTVLIDHHPGA